jgi:hypothetical protein
VRLKKKRLTWQIALNLSMRKFYLVLIAFVVLGCSNGENQHLGIWAGYQDGELNSVVRFSVDSLFLRQVKLEVGDTTFSSLKSLHYTSVYGDEGIRSYTCVGPVREDLMLQTSFYNDLEGKLDILGESPVQMEIREVENGTISASLQEEMQLLMYRENNPN